MGLRERFDTIEAHIRAAYPDVTIEVTSQVFTKHAEIWIYVFDLSRFADVQQFCRAIEQDDVALQFPEIWILTKTWTGPWPGGDSEAEIRSARELDKRRDEFRSRHNLVRASANR